MAVFEGVFDAAVAHGQAIIDRLQEAARRRAEDYRYDLRMARDLVQVAGSGATLWLLYAHKRLALPISVATAAVTAGLTVASDVFQPKQSPQVEQSSSDEASQQEEQTRRDKVINSIADVLPSVIGTLTVAYSPAAQNALDQPMNLMPRNPSLPFTIGERVRNATSLFAVYTLVGHWLEMAFCQLIRLGVVGGDYDRSNTMLWDWWLHPFPAEGIAGLLIAGVLSPLHEVLLKRFGGRIAPALAVSFLANQVVCTSIDYLTGMVANRNYELWDYRDMPFNFQGQICLQNSLVYTAAATLVAWLAYPACDKWLRRMPADLINLEFSALMPTYALLCLTYFV